MENPETLDKARLFNEADLKEKIIPFLEGRPKRETIITQEDILNLKIASNTARNMKEFYSLV